MTADVQVAVIGAGPYGLSLASYLREARISHVVLGQPLDTWRRHMPKGMYLKSEGFASSIGSPRNTHSLAAFCKLTGREYGHTGVPVSLETFVAYGTWFEEEVVPGVVTQAVTRLSRNGTFSLGLDDGATLSARQVVIAAGMTHCSYTPQELAALPAGVCTHTFDHDGFDEFAGRVVAVVGAGQSALESAALLRECGARPRVVVRGPTVLWNRLPRPAERPLPARLREPVGGLGAGWSTWLYSNCPRGFSALPREKRVRLARTTFGPAGAWWLRERVENKIDMDLNSPIAGAAYEGGRVALDIRSADGSTRRLEVDHVLAATGYRGDVSKLGFLDDELERSIVTVAGDPVLTRQLESSVPGLFFAGRAAANTFGPVMRFVFGSSSASRAVTGRLRQLGAR
ncbi:MAG TPA: FAD-dependent oxidoreductase [Gaiellaceae bacterium]|nr:FAD-dependent oxidoreductase [Gaiellaceae bacterium]